MSANEVEGPVTATCATGIDAPSELVWQLLTDVERWPSWNPDVTAVTMAGELAVGSTFRWKAGPGTITSTVRRLDPPSDIAWTGKTLGVRATHVWRVTRTGEGTHVSTEEAFGGPLARVFRRPLQRTLEKELASTLGHLKAAAEARAR